MRYLIDAAFRERSKKSTKTDLSPCAAKLRRELSERNLRWALEGDYLHEVSMGKVPAVLYCEDANGRHGNFVPSTYQRIRATPEWSRRLSKVHTSARHVLLSHSRRWELDSSHSSDALLMNIFCHLDTLATPYVRRLLGIDEDSQPIFGHRPGIPLSNGRQDCTEIDMVLGDLLVEAKLTEYDFQTAPRRLIDRYRDLEAVFNTDALQMKNDVVESYQLIRGVLAAHATPGVRFGVLCDQRRPDLIDAWHRVIMTVKPYDLRCRLQLLTWQELAAVLPAPLARFLDEKYGLVKAIPEARDE